MNILQKQVLFTGIDERMASGACIGSSSSYLTGLLSCLKAMGIFPFNIPIKKSMRI